MKKPTKPRRRVLYVEGTGRGESAQQSECRRAFQKLFDALGVRNKPAVVACGGRQAAYERFCSALVGGEEDAWLLVDAEEPATGDDPWAHVAARRGDGWARPAGATTAQLHLMAVVMETWLVADRDALRVVFGPKLDEKPLPAVDVRLEQVEKARIYAALGKATRDTPAGDYGKGRHAFRVLALVSPERLAVLPWAARFMAEMKRL
ncbi:MAG: DUF4276 family protein [Myxococcales bacterium]|nr:DUF4276 family protein [Myxococcales bacterium]